LGEKIRTASKVISARDYYVEMQDEINKPIFVVGSPRCGTSILALCLGHHPNLFPVPKSSWMGEFAIGVAIAHQTGAARGDYSIFSAMEIGNDELFTTFGQSINDLALRHRRDLEKKTRALYSSDVARKKLEFLFSDEHLRSLKRSTAVEQPDIALVAKGCS
jgi:hypothetical protein